jgi:hypothetical protein
VAAGEDQQKAAEGSHPQPSTAPLHGAALAAGLLKSACAPGAGDPLRLEVIRTLAWDLSEELEALAGLTDDEAIAVEGALRAVDVANLAACTVPELLEAGASQAAAATYLAAGAVRALCTLAEAGVGDARGEYEQNILKDARGAAWRARFAVRQVDEFLETD